MPQMFDRKSWKATANGRMSNTAHFLRYGLPFFLIIIGSTSAIAEVYKSKYESEELQAKQVKPSVPIDVTLKKKADADELKVEIITNLRDLKIY